MRVRESVSVSVSVSAARRVQPRAGRRAPNLGARVAALDAQLVDLALGDVGPFFGFVQLVLELPELAQVDVCLLLLSRRKG